MLILYYKIFRDDKHEQFIDLKYYEQKLGALLQLNLTSELVVFCLFIRIIINSLYDLPLSMFLIHKIQEKPSFRVRK
jgi:hypothetical protein